MLHILEGPVLRTHYWWKKKRKAQHLAVIEPMTSLLRGVRSTTVLQPLPISTTVNIRNARLSVSLYTLSPLMSLHQNITSSLYPCVTASLHYWILTSLRHCVTASLRHCVTASLLQLLVCSGLKKPIILTHFWKGYEIKNLNFII